MDSKEVRKNKFSTIAVWLILVGLTIGVCVLLIRYWKYLSQFQIFVYVGLFLTAILAGSPIPIPTPCMALTFTLGSKFEPVVIGIIASSGAAIGSMLVYLRHAPGGVFSRA